MRRANKMSSGIHRENDVSHKIIQSVSLFLLFAANKPQKLTTDCEHDTS